MLHEPTLYWSQASASNYAWLPEGRESQPTDTLARITSCCSELIREWVQKYLCPGLWWSRANTLPSYMIGFLCHPTIPNNTCCLASASSLFLELPCFKKFAFLASSIIVLDCHLHWLYIRGNHKPHNKFQSFRPFGFVRCLYDKREQPHRSHSLQIITVAPPTVSTLHCFMHASCV